MLFKCEILFANPNFIEEVFSAIFGKWFQMTFVVLLWYLCNGGF